MRKYVVSVIVVEFKYYPTQKDFTSQKRNYFMKLAYKLIIETPSTHQVRVIIAGKINSSQKKLDFFSTFLNKKSIFLKILLF